MIAAARMVGAALPRASLRRQLSRISSRALVSFLALLVSGIAFPAAAEDLGGGVELTIKRHASFVLEWNGVAIYVDPSRGPGGDPFGDAPPDLILVTRMSLDHLDVDKVRKVIAPETTIIAPALPEWRIRPTLGFQLGCARPLALATCAPEGWERLVAAPGDRFTVDGVHIDVIEGGNPNDRVGCCVGYIVTLGATRIFIAGESWASPAMLALRDIDVAFLPLRFRRFFGPGEAADAVAAFRPRVVYPYMYLFADDPARFAELVGDRAEVRLRDWH